MKKVVVLLMVCMWGKIAVAQELKTYVSPRSLHPTLTRVYDVLLQNELKQEDTKQYISSVNSDTVYVVSFSHKTLLDKMLACEPTAMLDMPLKVILWQEYGENYVGFMPPDTMKRRFMAAECQEHLHQIHRILLRVVNDVIRK